MAQGKHFRLGLMALLLTPGLVSLAYAQSKPRKTQKILIETTRPYDRIKDAIKARGGKITREYKHIDGIAAEVPDDAIEDIRALVGSTALDKDVDVMRPTTLPSNRLRAATQQFGDRITALTTPSAGISAANLPSFATKNPDAYSLNNAGTRIEKVHAKGFTGQGVVVAVIDSGVRPSFKLLTGSFIGGYDFVDDPGPDDPTTDWKKDDNEGHGTFSAGLISGNATFGISGSSSEILRLALQRYAPRAIVDGKLPIIGTAPESKIYVVRVFGNTPGVGTSISTILEAIEHVIDQRELYDRTNGNQGVKIEVANLSLGISTLAAGRTLLDRSVDAMLRAGIIPVVSVGNVGPATLTGSSPGSAKSSITVGGLSRAANERIANEVYFGTEEPDFYYPGVGGDYRPFDGTEVAYFSSRGPHADGRLDPDVVASGVGNIGQGYCPDQILDACSNRISFASGTSFSAPIVAGIAAALRDAFPNASATKIRNAIIASGRASQIEDYFDGIDRGNGLPDAWAAYQLLESGNVDGSLPQQNQPDDLVSRNIEQNSDLEIVRTPSFSKTFKKLKPGQRAEILFDVPKGTEKVIVTVKNVELKGPQNPFYGGDAMYFYVHSAKTSSIGAFGDYLIEAEGFFGGEGEVAHELIDPDTGVMRIIVNPDGLNAGTVNAEVSVQVIHEAWPRATVTDTIRDGKTKKYNVDVPAGQVDFFLTWEHDWAHYPTNDIDFYVCPGKDQEKTACMSASPDTGHTLAGPERISVSNPAAGKWTVVVHGFNVPTGSDEFKVRIGTTP